MTVYVILAALLMGCATAPADTEDAFIGRSLLEVGEMMEVRSGDHDPRAPLRLFGSVLETAVSAQGSDLRAFVSSRRYLPLVSYQFLQGEGVAVSAYALSRENTRFAPADSVPPEEHVFAAVLPELRIGALEYRNVPVFVLDDREQEYFPEGYIMELGNLLWTDGPVRLNLREGLLYTNPIQNEDDDRQFSRAPLTMDEYGLLLTPFRADSLERELVLDLESEDGIVIGQASVGEFALKYPERVRGFNEIMRLPGGGSSSLSGHSYIVPPQLYWGEVELADAAFEIWQGNRVPDTMGIGFVLHFDLILDIPGEELRFVRYPATPFEELMSYGFLADLYSEKIIRVYAGSRARETGMRVGSQILSLDEYLEQMESGAADGEIDLRLPGGRELTAEYELEWMFPEAERGSLW